MTGNSKIGNCKIGNCKSIGKISNYYGGLCIMESKGKYYWLIENYDTDFDDLSYWSEIDKELYDSLVAYDTRSSS